MLHEPTRSPRDSIATRNQADPGMKPSRIAEAYYAALPKQRNEECWASETLGMFRGYVVSAVCIEITHALRLGTSSHRT